MHNNQTRMQYPSQRPQPNQFGAYSQGMTQDIGTTRSEQMMQSGMGGISQAMQADRNAGYYGPSQPQQQWMQGGMQYGRGSYGGPSYGGQQGYFQPNQYGAYSQGMTQDIGTTRTEQMMQGGMGGISQAMQADRNAGYYGPSQPQQQWMQGGMQYGRGSYGGPSYGGQQGYSQPNQYGAYSQGMTQDIGTTRSEQMMQGGMGGISQAMQADRNTGYYGPSQPQQQWGQGGMQYGRSSYGGQQSYPQPNQYGAYSQGMTQDIGTTRSEQMMQGGMGGLSQTMQADRNTGYYGPSQPQQSWGQSGAQGTAQSGISQSYSGTYNPGDTPIEQQAKQSLGVSSGQIPSDEF